MKTRGFSGRFGMASRLLLALVLVVFGMALLPAGAAQMQAGGLTFSPSTCCTGATVGVSWTQTFTVSGGVGNLYDITVSGYPAWLTVTPSNDHVTLSGTPNAAGSSAITIVARDVATGNKGATGQLVGTLTVAKATPTVQIVSVNTAHPSGTTYMVHYPITVVVRFNGTTVVDPTQPVAVSSGGGSAPSCNAALDAVTREGECDLVFSTDGNVSITAHYPGDDNFNPSASGSDPVYAIHVEPFVVTPVLSAGRTHTCFLNAGGDFSCWGKNDNYNLVGGVPEVKGPVLAVSAGGYHTCFINIDGTIDCWGDESNIKGTNIPNQAGRRFIEVSSGGDFACAVDTRANLYCWGILPAGINAYTKGPFRKISAGFQHVCALNRSNSSPVCWGNDNNGQSSPPGGLTHLKAISAGYTHTCAIASDDGLTCWGAQPAAKPTGKNFTQIESGSNYSCALNTNNRLECWGDQRPAVDSSLVVDGFSSGYSHTCALKIHSPKNYLSCWGWNFYGQAPRLSLSPAVLSPEASYIPRNTDWSQVFTYGGGDAPHTLALQSGAPASMQLSGGTVTWRPTSIGDFSFSLKVSENPAGTSLPLELSPLTLSYPLHVQDPSTTITITPALTTPVDAGTQVVVQTQVSKSATPLLSGTVTVSSADGSNTVSCQSQVSSSGTASCSLYFAFEGDKSIQVRYLGNNFYHASDSYSASIHVEPIQVTPLVSAGSQFSCSLSSAGQAACWGKNDAFQTSPSTSIYRQISAADGFACGLSLDTSVYCWGWNGYGLNQHITGYYYQEVTTGSTHACALSTDGTGITCWGNSADGRTTPPASGPTYSSISAGSNHTCALKNDGTVVCWGLNTYGQASAPALAFSSISAGGTFTCGILSSGSGLSCWGGTGMIDSIRSVPAGSFRSIDAGYAHACAVRSIDNTVVCWGDAADGKTLAPAHTFRSVSAGRDHSCGIRQAIIGLNNDIVECWGNNALGQAPTVTVQPATLESISVGAPANIQLAASGGRASQFRFEKVTGMEPPAALDIDSSSGLIYGTPTNAGEYNFAFRVMEAGYSPAFMAEPGYHLIIRSHVLVEIQSISPQDGMVGKPVTVQVRVRETPGSSFSTPPLGTVTVQSSDGKSCQAALAAGSGASTASCAIFFTTSGAKDLSAAYPGDAHFLPGSTETAQTMNIAPFAQPPQVRTSSQHTFLHFADGSSVCLGAGCYTGGLTGTLTTLSVSDNMACGLGTDGQVRCRDAITPAATAQAVENHGPYIGLAVGSAHACAIQLNGAVFCWGDNFAGQASPPAGTFAALSAGALQTCGIRADGHLACWGSGGTPPGGLYARVSVGSGHACALNQAGGIVCWGENASGQSDAPTTGIFQAVSVGDAHSCALSDAGQVTCWGENTDLQATAPYGVFTTLGAAGDHTCALRAGPRLTCWGGNTSGEAPQILVSSLTNQDLVAARYWEFAFNPSGGTRPYQGSVMDGQLPPGVDLSVTLSPAGVILYGTPQVPGIYPFVLQWEDTASAARPIPLVLEKPYSLRVTGADLSVSITPVGSVAMADNLFSFTYTLRNLTSLPVPSVQVTVDVPEGMMDVTYTGLDGCTLLDGTVTCTIPELRPDADQSLKLEGKVKASGVTSLSTAAEIQPLLENWPELYPSNNAAELTVPVAYQAVIFTDPFDCLNRNIAWSSGECKESPSGVTYLGDFDSDSALRLQISGLAPHKWVEITFDLYVIGPWAGNNPANPSNPSLWSYGQTTQPAFLSTTFCNDPACNQAYPSGYLRGTYPAQTGAAGINVLGYPGVVDSRYRLKMRFDHTGSLLDLTFVGTGLPPSAVWGIDDVQVTIGSGISFLYLPFTLR